MNSRNRRPGVNTLQNGHGIKIILLLAFTALIPTPALQAGTIAQTPLFIGQSAPPLILITMGRDHKLYYEAYNDASDLNDDGVLDTHYKPAINYYGYFDSHMCYSYASGVFSPVEKTTNKQCTGSTGRWSGDYLNYLTMSRMDALRRVLYGGYRSADSTTETILERSYIPQDAHSWGKEYTSTAVDGYDIAAYTPLSQPAAGTRHLFANTTLLCPSGNTDPGCSANSGLPLLRVLNDTVFRVWEWLSIERPVAGVQCATGNNVRTNCANTGGNYASSPSDSSGFDLMETLFANSSHQQGSGTPSNGRIDNDGNSGTGNPYGDDDYYLNIFTGSILVSTGGTYQFAVDGDDAVDVLIDGTVVASYYGAHGKCSCQTHSGSVTLSAGTHTVKFRHQEIAGGDNYYLWWNGPDSGNAWVKVPAGSYVGLTQTTYSVTVPSSSMNDYVVRVKACTSSSLLEEECRGYPSNSPTVYKPTGVLHEYGENKRMAFGLLTGSYAKNTSGGVLRKNISYFADDNFSSDKELSNTTGVYTATNGIVKTIDKLKIYGFGGDYYHNQDCGVPEVNNPLAEGRCRMWGNPIGEMMYEGLRYFSGKTGPTSEFSITSSGNDDSELGLPLPSWQDPYRTSGGFPSCSKPSQLVISDINPSYDTDKVPGSYFNTFTGETLNGTTLNVQTLANTIWAGEYGAATPSLFIGQSGTTYDGAPTPKTVSSFSNIRGLAPEEPTKQGGFYSASVALFGKTNDLSSATGNQKTDTFSVAIASPLPRLELPVSGHIITLVPFGKTVGGCGSFSIAQGSYQPTNTIVDFYVDTIKNTAASNADSTVNGGRPYAKFRINYEDSEYGSDHDMDAIVEYELSVTTGNTLDIKLTSGYAAGGCIQHMGYVISGTTADGIYLEVRDSDTASGSDVNYFLDTPNDSNPLPLITTRNFTAGSTASASFVAHDPLWYAAKWGGFIDTKDPVTGVGNNQLDAGEWDTRVPGVPDSYFLVTNAGKLKDQLRNAFNEIDQRESSSSSVATNSTSAGSNTLIYQARFNSRDWSGQLRAFRITSTGGLGDQVWDTNDSGKIPTHTARNIYSYNPLPTANPTKGIVFSWSNLNDTQKATLDNPSFLASATSSPVVSYLRGDQSNESASNYRPRTILLGDVVNSDPWFVGVEYYGYENLPNPEGSSYGPFRSSSAYLGRKQMLYVGANDGMLHAFDASAPETDTNGNGSLDPSEDLNNNGALDNDGGEEIFAFMPNTAINTNLPRLLSHAYTSPGEHKYFVDGSPRVGDAYFGGAWHTVLVGTTGAGGKGIFALDVTNPSSFGTSNVLWEINSANSPTNTNLTDDPDSTPARYGFASHLGYTMSQASIVRMHNGSWAVVFGNGYNSASGKAVLYIVNIQTGALIRSIKVSDTTANGLSTPIVVDDPYAPAGGDQIADYIYAGDLQGNLWKFDVRDTDPNNWVVANSGSPLFTARDASNVVQPITMKPQVGRATATGQNNSGLMVYFGTGKYFEETDNIVDANNDGVVDAQTQTFYGIWDIGEAVTGRSQLQVQSVTNQACLDSNSVLATCPTPRTGSEVEIRVTSQNSVCYDPTNGTADTGDDCASGKKGWYMDVLKPSTLEGERMVSTPLLRGGRIIFTTLTPSLNPCDFGGTGWLMEVDAPTGQRTNNSPFDVNNDHSVSSADNVYLSTSAKTAGTSTAASGLKSTIGIIKTPSPVSNGTTFDKWFSGSSGALKSVRDSEGSPPGRQSWRQLR